MSTKFRSTKEGAKLGDSEPSIVEDAADVVHGWCLYLICGYGSEQEVLSIYADDPGFGAKDTISVGTKKDSVGVAQHSNLASTTIPGGEEDVRDGSQGATFVEEPAAEIKETTKPTMITSKGPHTSDWAYEPCRMRIGTESLSSYLKILEVEDNGNATRDAVVIAFLQLVNLERKKRGAYPLPSLCTAHRVLSSGIPPHMIMLGTTTVASFVAQLSFNRNDEVELVNVYAAWDRLGREEKRQRQIASMSIMGALCRMLGRLT